MSNSETEPRTRVGHCKADETDEYVGRGQNGRHMLSVGKPGLRGWLGNPFTMEDYSREESIEKFREAFADKLDRHPEFRDAVRDLAGQTLGCWCQRLDEDSPACHAEVIAEKADKLARETHIDPDRGLWIPTDLREFDRQIVFRTPCATIQHFGSTSLDGYYGAIDASHFGDPDDIMDPRNPSLAPDRVSIKPAGEDPVELAVDLNPDLLADGGQSTDGTNCEELPKCGHCGKTCLGSRDGETTQKSPHCPWCGFPQ
jgi:hypothetical protein